MAALAPCAPITRFGGGNVPQRHEWDTHLMEICRIRADGGPDQSPGSTCFTTMPAGTRAVGIGEI